MRLQKNSWVFGCVSLYLLVISMGCSAMSETVVSPDGKIKATFSVDKQGRPTYAVACEGKEVIRPSVLGLERNDGSFAQGLMPVGASAVEVVRDSYMMLTGKKKQCEYLANRRVFTLKNADEYPMDIIFQVSNDGLAFRYAFNPKSDKNYTIEAEKTSFAFTAGAVSWLHPMQPAKSGWSRSQPSYEEYYEVQQPVGKASPFGQGWCMPALFKTADGIWVLICDSDVTENYCAVHLAEDSTGGLYKIAFPQPKEHRGEIDPVGPQIGTPFVSPWRVMMIGQSLNTLVESTLMTDVATPCRVKNTDFIKPGKASWHWLRYGDESSKLETIVSFLDFAVAMKWDYTLVDANWDQYIGYEKMAEFVRQAAAKQVGVILWYNSNGSWNDAPVTPKNRMHEEGVRREEFARLRDMGVKGVKVDFFGGDKQATMKLYLDTLKDAADFGILVNFHGATIPRGWQRTWPNLVTMEAVRGMEYCTFEQPFADKEPIHCCILPFTRNVISSMDYTPTVVDPKIRGVRLVTTPVFEIALPVVFESGVQHLGLDPAEMKLLSDEVKTYLREVPTVWDETKLLDGYPAQYAVMARRSGSTWYVAGINGQNEKKSLTLDLSFAGKGKGILIADGPDRAFAVKSVDTQKVEIEMLPHGGFVAIVKQP